MEGSQAAGVGVSLLRALKTFELDDRGVAHVCERLTDLRGYSPSLEAFCLSLCSVVDSEKGYAWTRAPPDTPPERLYRFEEGGLLPENLDVSRAIDFGSGGTMMAVESLFEDEVAQICAALEKAPDLVGTVVDPMPRKGEPLLADYDQTIFYVGDSLYHLIDERTPYEAADLAMSASPFWSNLVVLSRVAPQIDAQRMSSEGELRRCAAAAVQIQCSAYDGEGYVVWRRA